jgi:hypothetical protein
MSMDLLDLWAIVAFWAALWLASWFFERHK